MTEKTNTKKDKQIVSASEDSGAIVTTSNMTQDLKNAVLIVSVVANLFILTAWVALQVTSQFDAQLSGFLFNN